MDRATKKECLQSALIQMQRALELLDAADGPPAIGAHLDLAICQLRERIETAEGCADTQTARGDHASK
jgi:hypothetical protein